MNKRRPGSAPTVDSAPFATTDWSLLAIISIIWGSAFLWTAIALEDFSAESVAFLRVALGATGLAVFPSARRRIAREDWPKLLIVAVEIGSDLSGCDHLAIERDLLATRKRFGHLGRHLRVSREQLAQLDTAVEVKRQERRVDCPRQ
ncbi:MAG: hypothetical protein IIB27_07610 [Chloroflexi bacterium]|nr:hypothetical protein [Chloroflexota bacterium]